MHVRGRDHSVVVTFDRPIQGKFVKIYAAQNRLAIMERSVYIFASPIEEMAFELESISRVSNRFFTRFLAKNMVTGEVFIMQEQLEGFYALRIQFLY